MAHAQDDDGWEVVDGPFGRVVSQGAGYLQRTTETELSRLQRAVELSAAEKIQLQNKLTPLIKIVAGNTRSASWGRYSRRELPPAIVEAIAKHSLAMSGKSEQLDAYLTDLRARQSFRYETSAKLFVVQVDRAVGLAEDQIPKVETIAKRLARTGSLPISYIPEGDKLYQDLGQKLAKVLTAEQSRWWIANAAESRIKQYEIHIAHVSRDEQRSYLEPKFRPLAESRISQLASQLKLSNKQVARLKLASKGAVAGVIDDRLDAQIWLSEQSSAGNTDPVHGYSRTTKAAIAMVELSQLLFRHSRWRGLMLSVLDEQQKEVFLKSEAMTLARERDAFVCAWVLAKTGDLPMTARERTDFRKLIAAAMPKPDGRKPDFWVLADEAYVAIEQHRYASIFSEENLASINTRIGYAKQNMPRTR